MGKKETKQAIEDSKNDRNLTRFEKKDRLVAWLSATPPKDDE